jgi:hypothetical protein
MSGVRIVFHNTTKQRRRSITLLDEDEQFGAKLLKAESGAGPSDTITDRRSRMARKHKSSPPSRRKYEQANPVISFRVPKEVYDRLLQVQRSGVSRVKVLKAGLGLYEPVVRAEEGIRQQGYDEGYEKAADTAFELWAVTYPCRKCGKEMRVDTEGEKKAIREFLIASGWGHGDCSKA